LTTDIYLLLNEALRFTFSFKVVLGLKVLFNFFILELLDIKGSKESRFDLDGLICDLSSSIFLVYFFISFSLLFIIFCSLLIIGFNSSFVSFLKFFLFYFVLFRDFSEFS